MLTIPYQIKLLFVTEGTRKNFRAHFPNGEMADITNENIVRESVKFSESLCSQEVLKFGLTEASMIEFETVGIGNMYGMTIECGMEIDTSSLSAGEISAIESDPGDGVLVKAADSDIGYGYYRVPYGVFRVESCPRNQQAMTHRQVTAYSKIFDSNYSMAPFERWKLAQYHGFTSDAEKTFTPSAKKLVYESLGAENAAILLNNGFTKATSIPWSSMTDTPFHTLQQKIFTISPTKNIKVDVTNYYAKQATISAADNLYGIDMNGLAAVAQQVYGFFSGIYDDYATELEPTKQKYMGDLYDCFPYINTTNWIRLDTSTGYDYGYGNYTVLDDLPVFYPILNTASQSAMLLFPYAGDITVSLYDTGTTTIIDTLSFDLGAATPPQVTIWTDSGSGDDVRLIFNPTSEPFKNGSYIYVSFADAVDFPGILNGYLETQGVFCTPTRAGTHAIRALENSSPVAVGPGDTDELWWNEYNVSPIGTVVFSYKSGNGGGVVEYNFASGSSVYDMTGNKMLDCLETESESDVITLLDNGFVTRADKVAFTPVDLTIRALPWIEAGDALQITAEDGAVVDTYVMSHEITGIQALFDSIESKGGEMMESWEA